MSQSPETLSRISILRAKAQEGTLTVEEMKEAILLLRGDRTRAAHSSDASRRKSAKAAVPSAQDLLSELGL